MRQSAGFTLIELLVVVSVISLLSSIILSSVNEARTKARAIRTLQDFQQIHLALKLLALEKDIDAWWATSDFPIPSNPRKKIGEMIEDPERLGMFLKSAPEPVAGSYYYYENEPTWGDSVLCSAGNARNGVQIGLYQPDLDVFDALNNLFDGQNESNPETCGVIQYGSGADTLFYEFGINSDDFNL